MSTANATHQVGVHVQAHVAFVAMELVVVGKDGVLRESAQLRQ